MLLLSRSIVRTSYTTAPEKARERERERDEKKEEKQGAGCVWWCVVCKREKKREEERRRKQKNSQGTSGRSRIFIVTEVPSSSLDPPENKKLPASPRTIEKSEEGRCAEVSTFLKTTDMPNG